MLTVIATSLTENEIKTLKETFLALDKNGDGTLTLDEVKSGCAKHNVPLPNNFSDIFGSIDTDGSGVINYTEFIAATMDTNQLHREDLLWSAFRVLTFFTFTTYPTLTAPSFSSFFFQVPPRRSVPIRLVALMGSVSLVLRPPAEKSRDRHW